VNFGSTSKCRKKCRKFRGNTVPRIGGIHKLVKKFRPSGPFLDKKPVRKLRVLTKEKLGEIESRLEHTTIISEKPCARGQNLEIFNPHSVREVNFDLLKWHTECVHTHFKHLLEFKVS
jgi:hypothetical protein